MDSQNSVADGQNSDNIQPIDDGTNTAGAVSDASEVVVELGRGGNGVSKRKRGRPPKAQVKRAVVKPAPAAKPPSAQVKEDEDVCFICFDGGSLVLCDHRGCPKAYHPACIRRDEEFFESAAKWDCGWHICSICQKTAHHMCYTCTYSLCKGCVKKADYVRVKDDKGFCTVCMKTIMLIENNGQGEDGKVQADFDDKLSWEYLFKVYWVYLKGKLSLTLDELTKATNPWKEATTIPSVGVHNIANVSCSMTSSTSIGDLEEAKSKRRKIDEQVNIQKETVNMERTPKTQKATADCGEWASKELLDFVAHMKNGDTTVLSRFDVHALVIDYINKNNLRDPKNKNKVICDSRLKSLFGKPRVGHIQMVKLLEYHFAVKKGSKKMRRVNRAAVQVNRNAVQIDPDWNSNNKPRTSKDKKRKKRSKVEECAVHNKLDEFAAVDVYNMNLIYLRRDLMEKLLEDSANFHVNVVGSIVRIRISGCDLKHDMYRLVQVVGTSKVEVPYKVNSNLTDIMLEVLNLDKKETISIDAISDEEFSEEECRRLQRSIRCGLVKHFTVGEIQDKAVALQSVKLDDWMEKEILRLTHLRDTASGKGHKKRYRECAEKIQLLKTPDERERRLNTIPQVHSDPKMNPDYESDDTEEYFNKEHGDQVESRYSGKKLRSPKKRESRSRIDEGPMNQTVTTSPNVQHGSTMHIQKDASASTLEKSQHEVDCNGSTITKLDHQTTLSSSVSNSPPETIPSYSNDTMWHYLDPNGKVQGPFSLVLLQRWNTSGYFPADMRIWATDQDKSLLLTDVLKQHLPNYGNTTVTNKVGTQTNFLIACSETPSSTVDVAPYVPNPVSHEKVSDSQSFGQSWSANNNDDNNMLNYNPPSVESVVHNDTSNMSAQETVKIEADIKHALTVPAVIDLPGPTPNKMQSELDSKVLVQDSGHNNPLSWSSASSLVVGGSKLPVSGNGSGGCNSNPVKREEWDSGIALEVAGDHVATPTSNIDQNVNPPHQSTYNNFTTWHDVGEILELTTLAEESVSDLLAEVDAMESQYGFPSPTSRRNSFVDDLFNDSFDEFSPTPDQGTRSDGFSSSGDIQLPCHPTTTTTTTTPLNEHSMVFDFMKTSNGLQQHSFVNPEMNSHTISVSQRTSSGSMGFKWPEMIDINASAKAEGDEVEIEAKTGDVENGNYNVVHKLEPQEETKSGEHAKEMQAPKPIGIGAKLVTRVAQIKWLEGTTNHSRAGGIPNKHEDDRKPQPPPQPSLPPLTLGLDPYDPCDLGSETMEGKFTFTGRQGQVTNTGRSGNIGWDPDLYGSERDNSSNSQRDQSQQVDESGYSSSRSSWNKHFSLGGSGSGGGGGYSRPPPAKGQRVCRNYESGRCKKGASCKYLHPST